MVVVPLDKVAVSPDGIGLGKVKVVALEFPVFKV
jgi:hypothetical protein